jgi:IS30 family transposase
MASIARIKRKTKRMLVNALICKIQRWDALDTFILEKIKQYWSPEQISWIWNLENWDNISKDTIYRHIKKNHPELIKKYFRRKWKKYKYWTIKADYIKERKSIHERPIEAKLKTEFWHWEWDTVRWSRNKWWLVTFTERKSWYELVWKLLTKEAEEINLATFEVFCEIPEILKKTVTLDNWKEFVGHFTRKDLCGLDTYFADVWNAWQRWLNENTNGLLRQFFPKKSNMLYLTQENIDYYVGMLNNRPRKRLDYLSPIQYLKIHCADLN